MRRKYYPTAPSRKEVLFAAITAEDAIWHARNIEPVATREFPVFEILAANFVEVDRNWLDFDAESISARIEYSKRYWAGHVSDHRPATGERRPPRMEVLVRLPVTVGPVARRVPV